MNKNPVDKSKKNNIKCEHCDYWSDKTKCSNKVSVKYETKTNYWNRCKSFKWREDI